MWRLIRINCSFDRKKCSCKAFKFGIDLLVLETTIFLSFCVGDSDFESLRCEMTQDVLPVYTEKQKQKKTGALQTSDRKSWIILLEATFDMLEGHSQECIT